MAIAPTFPLAAPPTNPAARRYSILDAAVGPLDLPERARLADLAYTVPWCGPGPGGILVVPDCDDPAPEVDFGGALAITEAVAFTVQNTFTCMAPGSSPDDITRFARQRLEGSEHVIVETQIAAMLAASTPADLGTGTTIVDAVSLLESYAYVSGGTIGTEATQGYGLAAVIHMPIAAWAHLAGAHQITRDNGVWRTPLGTIVAPNAGLDGTTAYVTGQVVLWRAPAPWMPTPAEALNRVTNEYTMMAQRDYAAAWECFTGQVTLGVLA